MRYLIEVEVDVEHLHKYKAAEVDDYQAEEQSIPDLIIQEMAWVHQSGISVTAIKEVESEVTDEYEDKNLTGPWAFVEKYYPEYSSSDEIARANDLDVILTETYDNWGEAAVNLWEEELKRSFNIATEMNNELLKEIYEEAIQGYIESLKGEK